MTIASTTNRMDYVGNNTTDTYSYTFKIFSKNDLRITQKNTEDVETLLVVDTDYTVTGVGALSGGTIVLTDGNLATGYTLTIRRVRTLTQETDIRNQGDFFPESIENSLDHLVMIAQQQQEEIARSLRNPESVSATAFVPVLPTDITSGGGRALAINDAGDGFELGPSATEVAQAQSAINTAPPYYNVLDYGDGTRTDETLSTAITTLGSVNKYTLLIKSGTWTLNSNVTIPKNVQLWFEQGAIFNITTGVTITYQGPQIIAPTSQIISLSGTGAFNFSYFSIVFPEWWGAMPDGTTDCAPAMQAAINAINAGVGGEIRCSSRTYKMTTAQDTANKTCLAAKSNVHIICPVDFAEFDFDGVLSPNVINSCIHKTTISNFRMTGIKISADGTSFVNDGYSLYGIWLKFANNCHFERCYVQDVENGVIFGAGCYECSMIEVTAKNCWYHSLGTWATSNDPCKKMVFRNIKAYSTGDYAHTSAIDGFNFEETYDSIVDNVVCWNVGIGVRIENSSDNNISNITAFECFGTGFQLYIDSQRNNITNVTCFDNNRSNQDAIDTSVVRGNDWNHCEGVRLENNCQNNNFTNIIAYQTHATIIPFTSGSDAPVLGSKIKGNTSLATGRVRKIIVTSGSWGGGNAAGTMHLVEVSGTFNSSETLRNLTTIIPFNSGSDKPRQGDTLVGATSAATGQVLWPSNQGATGTDWTTGNASGYFYLIGVTGTFNSSENLNNTTTGTNNIATTNGASTAEIADIATTNGAMTVGTGSNKGFQKYGVCVEVRNLTGNDTASCFNNFINIQCFNNDVGGVEDRGHYNQFLNVNEDYNNIVRNA